MAKISKWLGFSINASKTKVMIAGRRVNMPEDAANSLEVFEEVQPFGCLCSAIDAEGGSSIWKSGELHRKSQLCDEVEEDYIQPEVSSEMQKKFTKILIFRTVLQGAETRTFTKNEKQVVARFFLDMWSQRRKLPTSCKVHKTNVSIIEGSARSVINESSVCWARLQDTEEGTSKRRFYPEKLTMLKEQEGRSLCQPHCRNDSKRRCLEASHGLSLVNTN